jgi:hypothetical protein
VGAALRAGRVRPGAHPLLDLSQRRRARQGSRAVAHLFTDSESAATDAGAPSPPP